MSSTVCRSNRGVTKTRLLLSAAAAVMLAGCSADADRFTSSGADPVTTASVPNRVTAANVGLDEEVSSQPIARAPSASQPPNYDYSKSYRAPAYKQPAVAAPQPGSAGSTVTVGPGMTLYSVARANNISVSELAAANGIQPPYSVRTGQRLRIPDGSGTRTAAAPTESFAEPESTPIVEPKPGTPAAKQQEPFKRGTSVTDDGASATHTVASGETLFSLGRKYGVSPFAIADANGLPSNAQLATGQRVRIPAGGSASAAKATAPQLETAEAPADSGQDTAIQSEENTAKAMPAPAVTDESAPAGEQVAEQAPISGAPGLRWPVRGKVISGFGPKANGLKNEGINIAVPEGTSIRAADSGVVAYAGNELKGYGNLVLIRHENGYVTAYAHAKELFVKRGDTVKRGDVIAKAGQTGSVSSPQLHFEVRKGATALDPMKYLSSSTAAN
jgi:murein DD-endopeptidase MepM/ murein hydrolase activator NlpD